MLSPLSTSVLVSTPRDNGMLVGLHQSDAARFGSLSASETCHHHYIRQISKIENDDMLVPAYTFMPKFVLSCFMQILNTDTAY